MKTKLSKTVRRRIIGRVTGTLALGLMAAGFSAGCLAEDAVIEVDPEKPPFMVAAPRNVYKGAPLNVSQVGKGSRLYAPYPHETDASTRTLSLQLYAGLSDIQFPEGIEVPEVCPQEPEEARTACEEEQAKNPTYDHPNRFFTRLFGTTKPQVTNNGEIVTSYEFHGQFPGPTLVVNPGDTLNPTFQNFLISPVGGADESSYKCDESKGSKGGKEHCVATAQAAADSGIESDGDVNFFHNVDESNLHTHGFHISPKAPSDDVLITISPYHPTIGVDPVRHENVAGSIYRDLYEYTYPLPAYHAPGTHWYHPHKHGAVSIQVENGMSGALIIQDPNGYEIFNDPRRPTREYVLVSQAVVNFDYTLTGAHLGARRVHATTVHDSKEAAKDFLQRSQELANADPKAARKAKKAQRDSNIGDSIPTLNGQYQPVLSIDPNNAIRLRIINAAANYQSYSGYYIEDDSDGKQLNMYLVALDGINLPRLDTKADGTYMPFNKSNPLVLAPGNRADVFVVVEGGNAGRTYNIETLTFSPTDVMGLARRNPRYHFSLGDEPEKWVYELKGGTDYGRPGELISIGAPGVVPGNVVGYNENNKGAGNLGKTKYLGQIKVSNNPPGSPTLSESDVAGQIDGNLARIASTQVPYRENAKSRKNRKKQHNYLRPFTEPFNPVRTLVFDIEFDSDLRVDGFRINHREFVAAGYLGSQPGDGPGENHKAIKLGSSEDWVIVNNSVAPHPFHIHVNPFWVTEVGQQYYDLTNKIVAMVQNESDPHRIVAKVPRDGDWVVSDSPYHPTVEGNTGITGRWWDTLTIPPGGWIKIRSRFEDFAGDYVMHCHILRHEDRGMMMLVKVVE